MRLLTNSIRYNLDQGRLHYAKIENEPQTWPFHRNILSNDMFNASFTIHGHFATLSGLWIQKTMRFSLSLFDCASFIYSLCVFLCTNHFETRLTMNLLARFIIPNYFHVAIWLKVICVVWWHLMLRRFKYPANTSYNISKIHG